MNKVFGLLGRHLGHSYSPYIHNHLGEYEYNLFEVEPDQLDEFMVKREFSGINITIPYKQDVMKYCDTISEKAIKIGAVNTIVNKNGKLFGDNTDYNGFLYQLQFGNIDVHGKKVLILGTGGASKAVFAVLQDQNARDIVFISRTGENNYDNLHQHMDCEVIVNTTPVGMYPNNGLAPLNIRPFEKLEAVVDLIYNPTYTEIVLSAKDAGKKYASGLSMLVEQARVASELFQDVKISSKKTELITKQLQNNMKNIILVGMPGCGKSSIAEELSKRLNRPLVDLDNEIVKNIKMSIPEFFSKNSESQFRKIESDVLKEFSKESGLVIATGGGIVTVIDNHHLLQQHSQVIFIKRNMENLPKTGRPLSLKTDLSIMYKERKPLYEKISEFEIQNDDINIAVDEIIEKLSL